MFAPCIVSAIALFVWTVYKGEWGFECWGLLLCCLLYPVLFPFFNLGMTVCLILCTPITTSMNDQMKNVVNGLKLGEIIGKLVY